MWSRRSFVRATVGLGVAASTARAAPPDAAPGAALRFLRVRHRTLLVEIGGRRVLVDPCFEPGLGAPGLFDVPEPAISAGATGAVDVVLVTGSEPGAFASASVRMLRGRDAWCLVGDAGTAKALRHQGFRRVRVALPGDVVEVAGLTITVSPSRGLALGPAVGFHVAAGGRAMWCAGAPPPVDVDGRVPAFARDHAAEVVAACAMGLSAGGVGLTLDQDDALLLAGLARARWLVPLHSDTTLAGVGALVLRQATRSRPPGRGPRLVVAPAGTWCRVGPFG